MQRDKEAVAALMREKQKKGTLSIPTRPAPSPFRDFKDPPYTNSFVYSFS